MDRFSWSNGLLEINETLVIQQRGVRLYDGDDKVWFCCLNAKFVAWHNTAAKTYTMLTRTQQNGALKVLMKFR